MYNIVLPYALNTSTVRSIPNIHMCDITHTGRVGMEEDSLFVYIGSDTYSSVNDDTGFIPQFGVDLDSIPPSVLVLCGGNMQCLYDYVQTGDVGLAESTASEEMELQNTRNILGQCTVQMYHYVRIYCSRTYICACTVCTYYMHDVLVLLCLNCLLLTS